MGVVCQIRRFCRKHHIAPEKTVLQDFKQEQDGADCRETSGTLQLEPRQKWAVDPNTPQGTYVRPGEHVDASGLGCQGQRL